MSSHQRKYDQDTPLLPYRDAWRRSGLEFFDRYPRDNGSIFLFNGYTGEAIYDVDRWGSPLPGARKFSHWFEPTIQVQLDSGEDGSSRRRVDMTNLRDLRQVFQDNEYRVKWHATEIIQRNVRAALARWRVARALNIVWEKHYDNQADRYSFAHSKTGEITYHKPWGMGIADLWAGHSDNVDEELLSLFLREESRAKDDGGGEDLRSWEGAKRERHRLYRLYEEKNFSEGPHCRICGPGSLKETSFNNVFIYPKKYYRVKPFCHPRDRQFESARMGSTVVCMDELVEKRITVDAYFVIRNASEHGALSVLAMMQRYRNDPRVLGVGLQRMAGSLLEEDEAGGATVGQKKYLSKALELLRDHPTIEWIQAEACAAIASMTSGLCVRKELEREHPDWLEDVVTAIMGVKMITTVVKEIDPSGNETRSEARVPSDMAHNVALHGCRILANMACDEQNRAEVARGSIAAVVFVAKLMPDDPVLAATVSTTIYNFVSRQETTHEIVVEAGAKEALQGMLNCLEPDPCDRKERELIVRAILALAPDGWRGIDHGLQDKDVPEARDGDSSSLYESSVSHESMSASHGNNDRELVRAEADDGDGVTSTT